MGKMIMHDLFTKMVAKKLCQNDRDFSVHWLGLSPSYYRLRAEDISIAALFTLWDRLIASGQFVLAGECMDVMREHARVNARSVAMTAPRNRKPLAERQDAQDAQAV